MSPAPTDVIIDCDPGIDDAAAIMMAALSGAFNIHAITATTGNLLALDSARNACRILDLLGANPVPVATGPLRPLVRPHQVDPFSHGSDGLGDIGLPMSTRSLDRRFAPDLLIETARAHPGTTLLCLAPLTNIALALLKAPDLPEFVSRIVFIGGNYGFNQYSQLHGTGTNPLSEWNVLVDPEAARIVFGSGIPLTALGVDVWSQDQINLSDRELHELSTSSRPEARAVAGFIQFVEHRGYARYCAYIDAVAVACLLDPTLVMTIEVGVDVETISPLTLGMTVVERREHHAWSHLPRINAGIDADFPRLRRLMVSTLSG